jgi:hypothetical protein
MSFAPKDPKTGSNPHNPDTNMAEAKAKAFDDDVVVVKVVQFVRFVSPSPPPPLPPLSEAHPSPFAFYF